MAVSQSVSISSTEEKFASSWSAGRSPADETIEMFVQTLLSRLAGHHSRTLDGVTSTRYSILTNALEIQGVAIAIEGQVVQPLALSLFFGPDQLLSDGSCVYFGSIEQPSVYGSSTHKKLVNQLLAGFPTDFVWRHTFIRRQNDWMLKVD